MPDASPSLSEAVEAAARQLALDLGHTMADVMHGKAGPNTILIAHAALTAAKVPEMLVVLEGFRHVAHAFEFLPDDCTDCFAARAALARYDEALS